MSSAEDSPAKTSATPGREPESTGREADSGASSLGSFAYFDPASSSWKTCQRCLVADSDEFSETWPRAGLMRNGVVFRRQASGPIIDATDSLWWPTPRITMWHGGDILAQINGTPSAMNRFPSGAVKLWPTMTTNDCKPACRREIVDARTPRTKASSNTARSRLRGSATEIDELGGSLNPQWVEWLMGFPPEWTALDASATPSSRKSRKSSGDGCSKSNGD